MHISERSSRHDLREDTYKYSGYDYTYQYGEEGEILYMESVYLTFDEQGNIIDRAEPSRYSFVYEWNADGTISCKEQTNLKNGSVTIFDYEYDEYGRLLHEYHEPKEPTDSYWFTYEKIYEYS